MGGCKVSGVSTGGAAPFNSLISNSFNGRANGLAVAGGASISGKSGRTSFRNENAGTPAAGAVEGRLGIAAAGRAANGTAGNGGAASFKLSTLLTPVKNSLAMRARTDGSGRPAGTVASFVLMVMSHVDVVQDANRVVGQHGR